MHPTKSLLPLFLLALLPACHMTDCVTANGEPVERTLEVDDFTGIVSEGSIDVIVTRGNEQRVVARGPAEIVGMLNTEVKKGVWHIGTKDCYNSRKPVTVEITMPDLTEAGVAGSGSITGKSLFEPQSIDLSIAGSGNIRLELNSPDVESDIAGSGTISLKGTTAAFSAEIAGSGSIHAFDLSAAKADVDIAGSGDVEVTVIEALDADIAGSGDVRYKGRPKVSSDIAGSGSVSGAE
jgi:hypothetical protein